MNALPAAIVPIACPAEPRAKLHRNRVMIVINFDRALAPAALTRCWHLVTVPVSRAPSHVPFLTRPAYGVFSVPAFPLGVEVVPYLVVSTFAAKATRSSWIVLENPPAHFILRHVIKNTGETHALGE